MTVVRTVLILSSLAGLAACASVQNARDAIVRRPATCADQTVQIYFEPDSAEVKAEGRAVIREAAAEVRGCKVERVQVLGLADATGEPGANLDLSRRRADAVTAALAAAGLPAGEFQVAAAGQAGAVTAAGAAPLRRRVDVVLRLAK